MTFVQMILIISKSVENKMFNEQYFKKYNDTACSFIFQKYKTTNMYNSF